MILLAKAWMDTLVYIQIALRYDLILVQEIRDSSETAIYSFIRELNKWVIVIPGPFECIVNYKCFYEV